MNGWKKQVEYIRRWLKRIKTWHLVILFICLAVLSAVTLRFNSLNMMEYRQAVIDADKTLDQAEVAKSAQALKDFVSAHMNTDTGQVPLQNLYNKAVQEAFAQVNDVSSDGYQAATEACKSVLSQRGFAGYTACVADAVGTSDSNFNQPDLPSPSLYYLSFAAPLWSFDSAGVSVALTFVVFFTILLKFLTEVVLAFLVRHRGRT